MDGDGDSCERVRGEGRTQSGGDSEDSADALVAMGLGAFAKSGLHQGIGLGESGDFSDDVRKFRRGSTEGIGAGRFAKVLIAGKFANAAGNFDHRKTAERKACRADAFGVDAGAERRIGEHLIEHDA